MTETVYLTLSHFNNDTRNYFLKNAGYLSLLDYELSTDNKLFELNWNKHKKQFVLESSIETLNKASFFSSNVPLSCLSPRVKEYLYSRFLFNSDYDNFEEYYLNNVDILPKIPVFVAYKVERYSKSVNNLHIKLFDNGDRYVYNEPVNVEKEVSNVLTGFHFFLNSKTNNSYILVGPENDNKKNSKRYSVNGWDLIEGSTPFFYRKSFGGFVVSKKYRNRLIEMGAKEN